MADEDLFDAAGLYTILRETHLGALSAIYQIGFLADLHDLGARVSAVCRYG